MIKQKGNKKKDSGFFDFFKTIFYAVIIAVIFRSLFFEPYNIPSGSMLPNLLIGDYLFVSKYSYGYSRYSFPFGIIPLPKNRVFASEPKRGDVAVFKFPGDNKTDYIKRIIGLPGDQVKVEDGFVFVNEKKLLRNNKGIFEDMHRHGYPEKFNLIEEENNAGKKYFVLDDVSFDGVINSSNSDNFLDVNNTKNYTVPNNHYFVMGDNREHSSDSRILSHVGYVPKDNLVGKAALIFLSIESSNKSLSLFGINLLKIPKAIRINRIGNLLN